MPSTPRFDHEKLEVYQLELQFIGWVNDLFAELKSEPRSSTKEALNQLDRASLSSLLNTAEGNGRRNSQQRARFFDDARGSAAECAACLDALVAKKITAPERIEKGKQLLVRIVSMLSKLVDRFDQSYSQGGRVRDKIAAYDLNELTANRLEDEDE